jgi:CRP-like cAMP-binding protein
VETLEPILARHPFLRDLPKPHLELLVGCASQTRFAAGELIFRMGDHANSFYLIRHGTVSLEWFTNERGAITIQTVGEGEAIGWSWLIPPYRWELDGRAQTAVLALAFDAACLRGKLDGDHDLGYEMYKRFMPVMAERLQGARMQVLDVHRLYA